MRKVSILLGALLFLSLTSVSAYTKNGTLRDNGDDYWDDSEWDVYPLSMKSGETLEISVQVSSVEDIFLVYSEARDIEQMQSLIQQINDGGDDSDLYFIIEMNTTYFEGEYIADRSISAYLIIFSLSVYSIDVDYTITSNLAFISSGSSPSNSSPTGGSGGGTASGDEGSVFIGWAILFLIFVGPFILRHYAKKGSVTKKHLGNALKISLGIVILGMFFSGFQIVADIASLALLFLIVYGIIYLFWKTPRVYPSQMYNQQGYNQQGYNQQGYNQQGYNQQGYNQQGYNQQGYNQQRQQGWNSQSANQWGQPRGQTNVWGQQTQANPWDSRDKIGTNQSSGSSKFPTSQNTDEPITQSGGQGAVPSGKLVVCDTCGQKSNGMYCTFCGSKL